MVHFFLAISLDFRCPDAITLIVEAYSQILMVGVYLPGLFVDVPLLVVLAAPAYILTAASYPFTCRSYVWQDAPCTIVFDGYYLLTATSSRVRSFLWPELVEVLPSLHGSLLCALTHELAPLLTLVGWNMAFEEPAVSRIVPLLLRWQI